MASAIYREALGGSLYFGMELFETREWKYG
jgi:hypothetical protein